MFHVKHRVVSHVEFYGRELMEIILPAMAEGIVEASSNPEMWIAVAAVVAFSSSPQRFFIALVVAAVALVVLRFATIAGDSGTRALIAVIALALWSAIGCGLRVAFVRYAT